MKTSPMIIKTQEHQANIPKCINQNYSI